jgi:hypothetical protein
VKPESEENSGGRSTAVGAMTGVAVGVLAVLIANLIRTDARGGLAWSSVGRLLIGAFGQSTVVGLVGAYAGILGAEMRKCLPGIGFGAGALCVPFMGVLATGVGEMSVGQLACTFGLFVSFGGLCGGMGALGGRALVDVPGSPCKLEFSIADLLAFTLMLSGLIGSMIYLFQR